MVRGKPSTVMLHMAIFATRESCERAPFTLFWVSVG